MKAVPTELAETLTKVYESGENLILGSHSKKKFNIQLFDISNVLLYLGIFHDIIFEAHF